MSYELITDGDLTPPLLPRPKRSSPVTAAVGIAAFVIAGCIFWIAAPTLLSHGLTGQNSSQQPLLSQSTHRRVSGWFNDNGLIDFDNETGFNTTWTTLLHKEDPAPSESDFYCDEERPFDDRRNACINNIRLLNALRRHTAAQKAVLFHGSAATAEELIASAKDVSYLGGRRILIAGDSTDRNVFSDFAELFDDVSRLDWFWIQDNPPARPASEQSSSRKRQEDAEQGLKTDHDTEQYPSEQPGSAKQDSSDFGSEFPPWPKYPLIQASSLIIPIVATPPDLGEALQAAQDMNTSSSEPLSSRLFRVDFLFLSGSLDTEPSSFDYAPTNSMERFKRFFQAAGVIDRANGGTNPAAYDAITINFALWDIAIIQKDILTKTGDDSSPGMPLETMALVSKTLESYLTYLGDMFPIAQLDVRLLHEAFTLRHASPANPNGATYPDYPTFKGLRVQQYKNIQKEVATRLGALAIPYANRVAGLANLALFDGLHPTFSANRLYIELLLRGLFDHVS